MKVSIYLLFISLLYSCSTSLKNIEYLHSKQDTVNQTTEVQKYMLRKGDNIFIRIYTDSKEITETFNEPITTNIQNDASIDLLSYTINEKGNITIPVLGDIYLEGLSLQEARDTVYSKASKIVKNPIVKVKHVNKKVSVLGEVKNPANTQCLKAK